MNKRIMLIINGSSALLLGWLYGGDALDALRSQSAEVSAYLEPPNLVFALIALAGTGIGLGAMALGLSQKRDSSWRGYRLMPIVAVVVLFVDLFILTGSKSPLSTADRTALTLRSFVEAATNASTPTEVPRNPHQLQTVLDEFGPPAYLLKGEPAKAWTLVMREGCTGPVTDPKGAPLGTLFYCVAADGKTAWVTMVALPVGTYFGSPALFARGDEPISGVVTTPLPEEPAAQPDPPPEGEPEGLPQAEVPDSGR